MPLVAVCGCAASVVPEEKWREAGAVPMRERRDRAQVLAVLGREKRAEFARSFIGSEVEVLVERVEEGGTASGWTGEYLRAELPGLSPTDVGSLLRVKVESAEGDMLRAGMSRTGK